MIQKIQQYKTQILIGAAVLLLLSAFIFQKVTAKETVLTGTLLNQHNLLMEDGIKTFCRDFLIHEGIDTETFQMVCNTSMKYFPEATSSYNDAAIQALVAQCAAGDMDFIGGDIASMTIFAYGDYFYNLHEVLSEEDFARYEPYMLYVDADYQRQVDEALSTPEVLLTMLPPDMRKPEDMVEPVPVLIDLTDSVLMSDVYIGTVDDLCFGFTVNSTHQPLAMDFLRYVTPNR